ncbi:hypothetical protein A2962_04770 [Candidatus Woesebacteria bacterium RIFCSPLOWO2_01_FULL_39_61]|uniref:Prepilin leader peptidase/N-methyltransferase n=1 Tax=Candidatus Woesebacteria bacterium RIFCSPHIGHO2_02_FULL_39_13 TaxID=1802505 RepID=A0A1F7Z3R9_9BACT|nr:MAG: hypothetical protein A2692_01090 [Candidatus Woesebacteria bacterium RIFCSPHIGHO2_01_FULL_39_95]OGM34313.1 MAG: hypothetical protein A3D01_00895 [Candidatus Woesebacteria bacterium RIFCSPHIGHO2_02_FULL_39_13]OGM39095.1 MAG: hypothetical protein A3E13_01620 [Candidatus Woesebacteria bacterium RIFCSPHIGHO2_12_FULL_40_20]OGM68650.1 MAG: hypothetical protein A2962_04770 [Candidatus Woesebacteria bacterium RIFCSPLOWO2_01_FULL_39_61]OGM73506.1 MAG: hypothetical protein A3H19_00365 [Candidatus
MFDVHIFYLLIFFVTGSVLGSFLSAYTYRLPRGISIISGRSRCPKCNKTIAWFDNIPILSYILLRGRCRHCHETISPRYPLIEVSCAVVFVLIYLFLAGGYCGNSNISAICSWKHVLGVLSLPYITTLSLIFIPIFVIDLENQFIPDELVFISLLLSVFAILLSATNQIYLHFFSGFFVSSLLIFLNIITRGRGMGLGDAKLAISLGLVLGWRLTPAWFLLSFILGGAVGVILIIFGKASFGKHIAFGPFMITAFFIMLFWGDIIVRYKEITF